MIIFPAIGKAIFHSMVGLFIKHKEDGTFRIEHSPLNNFDIVNDYHASTAEEAVAIIKTLMASEIEECAGEEIEWFQQHAAACQSFIDSLEHPFKHIPFIRVSYEGNKIFLHYQVPEEHVVDTEEHDANTIGDALLFALNKAEDYYIILAKSPFEDEADHGDTQLAYIKSYREQMRQFNMENW